MQVHLAVDLGAESGRVISVWTDGGKVSFRELHRFSHLPVKLPTGLHWNITQIWQEIVNGLQLAATWAQDNRHEVVSVGVDTWGVDWCLVDRRGELIGLPHAYRDPRNLQYYEEAVTRLSVERIYQTTGIQMMALNTLYSLFATASLDPELPRAASKLLFIPDLFHFWLSGEMAVERTIASTSQMINAKTGTWAGDLLDELAIPRHLLGDIVPSGTVLGKLRRELALLTGLPESVQVITPGSHDTASAVAAVPADGGSDWCYLSSGTWSLLGCELDGSLTNAAAQEAMFTNESGIGQTVRFLKNLAGLWLVQECRRAWASRGEHHDYQELTRLAKEARPSQTVLDTNWPDFQIPGDMPEKIARYARETGQPVPDSPGAFVRSALESLAIAYRSTLDRLEKTTGRTFRKIHIVGGGGQNELLNQLTADYTGRTVIVGPYEATAIGNGLVQAMALGHLNDLSDMRRVIREGIHELKVYQPSTTSSEKSKVV
jgi:rhamnulokinase